jgi:hypothetical protein
MKKRSSFGFLFATLGAVALFANCTVKSVDGDESKGGSSSNTTNNTETKCTPGDSKDCTCTNGKDGAQVCKDSGSGYAACVCDGMVDTGGSSNMGDGGDGNVSTGGTTGNGGYAGNNAYAGESPTTDGGAGGAAPVNIDPTDCAGCLEQLCAAEFDACDKDDRCPDQFSNVLDCITTARGDGLVKRDAVRGCGVTLGASPDPSTPAGAVWAPDTMAQATTDLINCLASGDGDDVSWANDDANFTPAIVPWKDGTCAKLACTSEIQ